MFRTSVEVLSLKNAVEKHAPAAPLFIQLWKKAYFREHTHFGSEIV